MTQPVAFPDFVQQILGAFPELQEDFASVEGMPTLYASILARRLQQAKGAADWDSYERGIRLVESVLPTADPELASTLSWTFLRGLDFDGPRGQIAWDILSAETKRQWTVTSGKIEALNALPKKAKRETSRRR